MLHKAHKIVVPFPDPKPDKNAAYKLAYAKPSKINVVGSYAIKTMIKSDSALSVDIVVVMPPSIFQEKDFLNYRYFYKRAYYLACIAAGLQSTAPDEFTWTFEYLNGNSLHPILVAKLNSSEWNASLRSDFSLTQSRRENEVRVAFRDSHHPCCARILLRRLKIAPHEELDPAKKWTREPADYTTAFSFLQRLFEV
jgi:hypothetical protein